jgi:hypothetical protein
MDCVSSHLFLDHKRIRYTIELNRIKILIFHLILVTTVLAVTISTVNNWLGILIKKNQ